MKDKDRYLFEKLWTNGGGNEEMKPWLNSVPIRLSYKLRVLLIWHWNFRCQQRKDVCGSKSSSGSHAWKLFTVLFSENFVILSVNKNGNNYYCYFEQKDHFVCYNEYQIVLFYDKHYFIFNIFSTNILSIYNVFVNISIIIYLPSCEVIKWFQGSGLKSLGIIF